MSLSRKIVVASLLTAMAAGVIGQTLLVGQTAPATSTAPATQAARDPQAVIQDLQNVSREIATNLGPMTNLIDADKRIAAAPKLIPAMKRMVGLLDEMKAASGDDGVDGMKWQIYSMLKLLGDEDTAKFLTTTAEGKDKAAALSATLASSLADYWKNNKDEEAQKKIVASLAKVAADNPDSQQVNETLMIMSNLGPASPAVRKSITALQGVPEDGKPFAFSGTTVDGKPFKSSDLKGKVVLVDFWATWCGPCIAELPALTKFYEKHKADGFEIVGVSLDAQPEDVTKFVAENKSMTWTQVFDKDSVLSKKYGIQAIPTMYLIDHEGNLVTTEARGKYEELVPQLIEKKNAAKK